MKIDYESILAKADSYKADMSRFLRDMLSIPGESGKEEKVIQRIKEEMIKVGFDKIDIDSMGNILGFIGHGSHLIAFDAHIDTVKIGEPSLWNYDPYEGYEDDEIIIGRGASDQRGGMASMLYAGKLIKEMKLEEDFTLIFTGTVQEEDCDGLCWQYIINEDKVLPEVVVLTEPTSCNIYRGHRGRMEIKIITSGIGCHGSAPERGVNAIYKMAPILMELEKLNNSLTANNFLGKGSLTVSEIFSSSPSRCAVSDKSWISIDRRLTLGEDEEYALEQIRKLPSVVSAGAEVEVYTYEKPSYKGVTYPSKCYFPSWLIEKDTPLCLAMNDTYKGLFNTEPIINKWTFSTNGTAIMGKYGIPCVGFGPGNEEEAHAPNEKTFKSQLVKATAMYAAFPLVYMSNLKKAGN